MKRFQAAALGLISVCVGCAGLPPKFKPAELSSIAPIDPLEASGGDWPAQQWWRRYQDPTLDQLIELALANSPSLATAQARYESARQSVRVAGAESGAKVTANGSFQRQRLSENGVFPPELLGFTWYNQADLGLQASYTFDWWGKQRDAVNAAMDQAHASRADRSAAALVSASSVADTYFGWQADQARLELAREREKAVAQEGVITAARIRAELDPADSMNRDELALAGVRGQIAALEGSSKLRVIELAALVGRSAADLPPLQPKPLPQLSAGLPDDVKIDLISRRADITASRWRVEAADRSLESARAEFYPDVTVNVLAGVSSLDVGKLFEYGSRVPAAGAAIHLPIFDAGRLKARYGATQASVDSAVTSYQETVIAAARDVAMQASSRAQIAQQRTQRLLEVDAAAKLRDGAAARARQELSDARPELAAAESWLEQRDELLQLDAAALSADVALQRALGGGYDKRRELANSPSTPVTKTP